MSPIVWGLGILLGYKMMSGKGGGDPGAPPGPPPPPMPPKVEYPPPGPPTPSDQDEAKQIAVTIDSDLRARGANYDRALMRRFQALARLAVDGLYGPRSAGALEYYLGHVAPPAIFPNRGGSKATIPYSPPSG